MVSSWGLVFSVGKTFLFYEVDLVAFRFSVVKDLLAVVTVRSKCNKVLHS